MHVCVQENVVCVCMSVLMPARVPRPEVNLGYCSSGAIYFIIFEAGSLFGA